MPQVPLYQRTERQRPILRQGINVQASPGDFGAQIGGAMQNVARGIGDVGEAVSKVQELESETRVRDRRNQYMQERDQLMYDPETGYLNQEGTNALSGRQAFDDKMKGLRSKYAEGLSAGEARAFGQAVDPLEMDATRSALRHNGQELKQYVIQQGKAGAANFQNEALRNAGNPAMADKYTAAGLAELRTLAGKQGLPAEAIDLQEREYLSDTTRKMTLQLAVKDPLAADAYMRKHSERLSAGDKLALEDSLKTPLIAAKASRNAQALITGAPVARYDSSDAGGEIQGPLKDGKLRVENGQLEWGGDGTTRKTGASNADRAGGVGAVLSQLSGLNENTDAGAISRFIKNSTGVNIDPRTTAWCAAFANAVLATQGVEGTGKLNARSFLNFGVATDRPQPGDIVVLKRGNNSDLGHVTFFNGYDENGNIKGVGGNQGDSIKESTYSAADVLAFRTAGHVNENTAGMPNYSPVGLAHIYEGLNKITDPAEREATRKQIDAYYTQQKKMMDAQREQVQTWAESQIISNPTMDISKIPLQAQQAIGASGMTTLLNYQEKVRSQGQPTTDYRVLYDLQTQYANDPVAFGRQDLFQYRDKLSNTDWKAVNDWRQAALTDQRKATEDGKVYGNAFKQAEQALAGAGLTTTGIKTDDLSGRMAIEKRIGSFQSELKTRIDDWKNANTGKTPGYADLQGMINELLLPIVIQKPGALWGTNEETGKFLFEAPNRKDNTAFEIRVPYEDIPLDLRQRINTDLQTKSGRKPTPEEVSQEYARFLTTGR